MKNPAKALDLREIYRRHFFLIRLKKQGVEGEDIQPNSGYEKPESHDIYTKTAMEGAQHTYEEKIKNYPI